MRILSLDQGTTSTRLLEVTEVGTRLVGQLRHATHYPAPAYVEMDAEEILRHCRTLLEAAGPADALAIANQGETCLAWDSQTGEVLSPLMSWQDRRSLVRLVEMARAGVAPLVTARSGLPLDPYFSASKLGWALANLPLVAAAQGAGRLRLGTSDAFLLDRLAGQFATDRATASRTGLMNLATGQWDARLCAAFGVPLDALPEIRSNIAGFGAYGRTPILAAIVDQQAALYGHGCRLPGQGKITFGTGAFALAVTGSMPPDPGALEGLLPTVAWDLGQGMVYAVDGGVQDAGSAVEWAIRAGLADDVAAFDGFEQASAVGRGLVFVPAFSGLGAPHWDRTAAPVLIGMTPDMTRRDLCQALLEGIAFETAALVGALQRVAGLAGPLSIDGGLTNSAAFAGFLADACGLPVRVSPQPECTALGAAALAAVALGRPLPSDPFGGAAPVIQPKAQAPEWSRCFAEAVARSRGWRSAQMP